MARSTLMAGKLSSRTCTPQNRSLRASHSTRTRADRCSWLWLGVFALGILLTGLASLSRGISVDGLGDPEAPPELGTLLVDGQTGSEESLWPIPGDVDGDGWVGGADLTTIITNWGQTGATRSQGDFDGDGLVGGIDYTEVVSYWGTSSPPPAPAHTPEPLTVVGLSMAVGGLTVYVRNRSRIRRN